MDATRNNGSLNRQSSENGGNLQEWKERVIEQRTKQEKEHQVPKTRKEAKILRERYYVEKLPSPTHFKAELEKLDNCESTTGLLKKYFSKLHFSIFCLFLCFLLFLRKPLYPLSTVEKNSLTVLCIGHYIDCRVNHTPSHSRVNYKMVTSQ